MEKPKVAVLAGFGVNCQKETKFAFELAGAQAKIIHLNDLLSGREKLSSYQCICLPGGFSFGDDISSGKVYGNKLLYSLKESLEAHLQEKKLLLGICNGFQTLVKMGILPNLSEKLEQEATLFANAQGKFEDRWVYLSARKESKCIFTKGISSLYLPVRHGEGRFIAKDTATMEKLKANGQVALQYCDGRQNVTADYPWNPNGSQEGIAGICDSTGRVFGLMPHPEGHIFPEQHPRWARGEGSPSQRGTNIFTNAVKHMREELI